MFSDKTLETSTTTGTGTFNLAGSPSGYRSFVTGIGSGNIAFYIAQDRADSTIWEVGYGTVTDASPDTLTRNLLVSSTGSLINFAAGTRDIWSYGIGAIMASTIKGNASATGRPGWLPASAMWIDISATPWILYIFDGTDNIQIATINASTNAITFNLATLLAAANTWTADQTLLSTSAGAAGPVLNLQHDSASPLANDVVAAINYIADDAGGAADTVLQLQGRYDTVTAGAEDASFLVRPMRAGTRLTVLTVGSGVQVGTPTGGAPGAGKINATGYQIAGVAVVDRVVQVVNAQSGAVATTTTVMPNDDSIPENDEGAEFLSLAITPTSATNVLKIEVVLHVSTASVAGAGMALFQDATVNALAATRMGESAASSNHELPLMLTHYMVAGTTSATTFDVRAGPFAASTLTVNGVAGARKFGGVMSSSITITEIRA